MQEMRFGIIDDCSNFKVLIVKIFNPEYFDLDKKVNIHDHTLFEPRTSIFKRTNIDFKWYSHIVSQTDGSQFSWWWFDKYMQNVLIKVDDLPKNIA